MAIAASGGGAYYVALVPGELLRLRRRSSMTTPSFRVRQDVSSGRISRPPTIDSRYPGCSYSQSLRLKFLVTMASARAGGRQRCGWP
jgi:hypothetical protein